MMESLKSVYNDRLSYWTVIVFTDTCELVTLGSMIQTLTYWPIVRDPQRHRQRPT